MICAAHGSHVNPSAVGRSSDVNTSSMHAYRVVHLGNYGSVGNGDLALDY